MADNSEFESQMRHDGWQQEVPTTEAREVNTYRDSEIARITASPESAYREIQVLRGSEARLRIEIAIVECLLTESDYRPSSIDMEYWHETHDKIARLLSENAALVKRVEAAEGAIHNHNQGLADLCNSMKCEGYKGRGLQCPTCPIDWQIEPIGPSAFGEGGQT